jgi:hypothetical protein
MEGAIAIATFHSYLAPNPEHFVALSCKGVDYGLPDKTSVST